MQKFRTSLIPLKTIPINWKSKYDKIITNEYVRKKCNRDKRLMEKWHYIKEHTPEVFNGKGFVIDIGPGPGEYLELCRYYGNNILGIDSKDTSDMGDKYFQMSKLMTQLQKIPVQYLGFENLLKSESLPFKDNSVTLVNSQGSIEMVMGNFLLGPPLKEHKSCLKMSWNINEEFKIFYLKMLNEVYRILKPDGIFLIYGNVCKNSDECDVAIRKLIKETKFNLEYTQRKTLYRLRKLDESIITS